MAKKAATGVVRRSVALPRRVVDEAERMAPPNLRRNLNRMVTEALREFAARRAGQEFERAMSEMAADPGIRQENAKISGEFRKTETDGLG